MDTTRLLAWYQEDRGSPEACGHVVAWSVDQPADEQGTPTGPPVYTLAGYADPIIATQLVEEARREGGLLWLAPGFTGPASLDNLIAIWGDNVVSTAVTHGDSNPTVTPTVEEASAATGETPTEHTPALPEDTQTQGEEVLINLGSTRL